MVKYLPIVDCKDILCLQNRTKRKRAIANHHLSAYYGLNIIKLWYIYYFPTSLLSIICWTEAQRSKKLAQVTYSAIMEQCPTLCDPMNCQASLSITNSWSSLKLMSIESVMPSNHLILCRSLLLLSPIPPSIRVFSNESTLPMR